MEKLTKKQLGKNIQESVKRYYEILKNGASDPFWSDGCNANLCVNHVIYYKKKCEELLDPENYPEEYYIKTPIKVDNNFMAKELEIKKAAKLSLEILKNDSNYKYIKEAVNRLTEVQIKKSLVLNPIAYVARLEAIIDSKEIVELRRYGNTEYYLNILKTSKEKVQEMLLSESKQEELPVGQLSLFDLYGIG